MAEPKFKVGDKVLYDAVIGWLPAVVVKNVFENGRVAYCVIEDSHGRQWSLYEDKLKPQDPPTAKTRDVCVCPDGVWQLGCKCGAIEPYQVKFS